MTSKYGATIHVCALFVRIFNCELHYMNAKMMCVLLFNVPAQTQSKSFEMI